MQEATAREHLETTPLRPLYTLEELALSGPIVAYAAGHAVVVWEDFKDFKLYTLFHGPDAAGAKGLRSFVQAGQKAPHAVTYHELRNEAAGWLSGWLGGRTQ